MQFDRRTKTIASDCIAAAMNRPANVLESSTRITVWTRSLLNNEPGLRCRKFHSRERALLAAPEIEQRDADHDQRDAKAGPQTRCAPSEPEAEIVAERQAD